MFKQIFKRAYTIKKHTNMPLLEQRLKYLLYWEERGRSAHTHRTIAQYLLRIIEFLGVETNGVITTEEIESAANKWNRYQSNYRQKRAEYSKAGKERFIWYAINWLSKMDRLKQQPEENLSLFNKIFERRKAIRQHSTAPLLEERLMYIQYWADNEAAKSSQCRISQYLLTIMKYLCFYKIRPVTVSEIEKAADSWAHYEANNHRKNDYSKFAKARFICDASNWLKMLVCLK